MIFGVQVLGSEVDEVAGIELQNLHGYLSPVVSFRSVKNFSSNRPACKLQQPNFYLLAALPFLFAKALHVVP